MLEKEVLLGPRGLGAAGHRVVVQRDFIALCGERVVEIAGVAAGIEIDAIDQTAGLLGEACDIWVPQLGRFDKDFDAIREHVGKGGEAWYYTCLYPRGRHLNRLIDYPLVKTRLLHWFNFRHDFTGYLHWGGNHWGADPYGDTEISLVSGDETEDGGGGAH